MRYLTPEIERLFREEHKMCFIAGPRQVGKTTLAKHLLGDSGVSSSYFNWDIESDRKLILRHSQDFWLRKGLAHDPPYRVALDEIHKFPRWKRFLKELYDAHGSDLELLVTGSGRLDIYQRGGDSLFGRYQMQHLFPFTVGELLSGDRSFLASPDTFMQQIMAPPNMAAAEEALHAIETFTGFPEPLFAESDTRLRRWSASHEQLILREELRDLTRIRELGLIDSLVSMLPERVGSPISINAIREDLGVRHETVQNWIGALARLYFLFSIRPHAGRLARTLRRREKAYLFDFSPVREPGPRFENIVALHLLKLATVWTDLGHGDFSLFYVRDKEGREVDFLITEGGKPFVLVEAKLSADAVDPAVQYFKERLKPRHAIQIVRTPRSFKQGFMTEGVLLVPAAQALAVM